jgi:hypothetical protein
MIRKPTDWHRQDEGVAVRTVRTATAVATGSANVARRGAAVAVALLFFVIAIFWGHTAIGGDLPNMISFGAMAAGMAWVGRRLFAKALAPSD